MKKLEKGFTLVELLVVIAILGILMVALVPNILGAITKAQMQTMAKQGADIVNGIITESASGRENLWPHLTEADGLGSDPDRIDGNAYSTSTDYFKKLFDIQNQTTGDWDPYIDAKIECLWGNGVPAASSGQLEARNVAWSIVAGAADMSSPIPALVTRNVDCSQFAVSGQNDMSKNKTKIGLEKKPAPFGKKGCIIILKGGEALALPARQCRLCDIYDKQPTVSIPDGITLKYLEP